MDNHANLEILRKYVEIGYSFDQIFIIAKVIKSGFDPFYFEDQDLDSLQMEQIYLGLLENINVELYSSIDYSATQMEQIRLGIFEGLNVEIYCNPDYTRRQMYRIRNQLYNEIYGHRLKHTVIRNTFSIEDQVDTENIEIIEENFDFLDKEKNYSTVDSFIENLEIKDTDIDDMFEKDVTASEVNEDVEDDIDEFLLFTDLDYFEDNDDFYTSIYRISTLLSPEDEELVVRRALRGDRKSFERFFSANTRLVVSVANLFRNYSNVSFSDILQEGALGLLKAIPLFDPSLGFKFSTYSINWIKQQIFRFVADNSRLIRLPVHAHESLNKINRIKDELFTTLNREPSLDEIIENVDFVPNDNVELLLRSNLSIISIDTASNSEKEIIYQLEDPNSNITELISDSSEKELVMKLLSLLTSREAQVIRSRFGIGTTSEMTLEQIGKELNVTRERVRQIEAKSLIKLAGRYRNMFKGLSSFEK